MTLEAESKLCKHPKANTLYLTIPAKMACDSQFPFKAGDLVTVLIMQRKPALFIRKKKPTGKVVMT